jgi:transketolase
MALPAWRPEPRTAISGQAIRRIVLEESKRAGVGHIGSALSIADILAALYGGVIDGAGSDDPDRDRFILSKGHAALALYAALHLSGNLSRDELRTYCGDGSRLGVHPDHRLRGIDFSTGSLGHGLAMGAGAALAARIQGSERRTYVLVSDAECNEGSLWEAVMFAGHHHLANLTAIVDMNGQQALGYTAEVLSGGDPGDRWGSFGWEVRELDGHDAPAIVSALGSPPASDGPRVLIARTVFGRGVSYMEGRIKWHYSPMSDSEYTLALQEVANFT